MPDRTLATGVVLSRIIYSVKRAHQVHLLYGHVHHAECLVQVTGKLNGYESDSTD